MNTTLHNLRIKVISLLICELCLTLLISGCNTAPSIQEDPSASSVSKHEQPQSLDAQESEPLNFGWMQGFPPSKDVRLSATDGSFFRFPALRWSVSHMREFMPTVNVSRGISSPSSLPYALDQRIDSLTFLPWGEQQRMTWEESLYKNYTDGIIILHRGAIVYERYFGELSEEKVHAVMSLSKSFTGTLASILVSEGILDPSKLVSHYIPELGKSAFGDATVRQVMDMTTGLKFSENYSDPNAEIWAFSAAGNPTAKPSDNNIPVGYFEYLETVKKEGEHGFAFGYRTVNTDVLGWIVSRVTNQKISDLLSAKIWKPLGMEQDAYYQIDALGTPFAGGGLNAGLRDLARFGELIRNKGVYQGKQIIPEAAVKDIMMGGDIESFRRSPYTSLEGWSYRNMWWITHNEHEAFAARGVHGQTIYIDPKAEMVLVRLASHPMAGNAANDPYSLPAYHALANYFLSN